ncbi:MAG: RadC family protein [Eubacterium sp.]|nr:RadC family protein [Eubacterium sp.]
MPEINRQQHRERVRKAYLNNSFESMPDSNVLEMVLFYAIPRKDVKDVSYALINRFGSLEGVLCADIKELVKVEGVGENTAILINLIHNIDKRLDKNKNKSIKKLDDSSKTIEFVKNELSGIKKEKILVITLDNGLNIIAVNDVSQGNANTARVESYKIMECVFKDSAANVILAHNHPNGEAKPSMEDIDFTIKMMGLCRQVGVRLNDHIIIGKDSALSMATDFRYCSFFEEKDRLNK